ncbi:hypothetical protein [Bacillus mycoides]|uniref:hypothetical protein n=1 Tax=Bacillus mycoides TaxID=1405 RepID=UPI000BF6ED69|nr:hypothetical protein [Bacillus mycoides]PGA05650.1 hypothetical protein COL71_25995 [Bacillus mycoides]
MTERVVVVVFVENSKQMESYFKLFRLMIKDNIQKAHLSKHTAFIESDKFHIGFHILGIHSRGIKAHYVINLVQNEELHHNFALPVTNPHSYLKDDPKWAELF